MKLAELYLTHRLKDQPDFKKIKTRLLTPLRFGVFEAEAAGEWKELLTAVLQLSWGKPVSEPDLGDLGVARAIFEDKVVRAQLNGQNIWLELFPQLGTHIPKTHNDKVGWAAFRELQGFVKPVPGGLTGADCTNTARISGAGNGAYVAHYTLLSLLVCHQGKSATLFEWIAQNNQPLQTALKDLGVSEELWSDWTQGASAALGSNSTEPIDRYMKQIYIPNPEDPSQDLLVTPLPSTALLTGFEARKRSPRAAGIAFLSFDGVTSTQIGGTKPQNAGSLVSYMAGYLPHLQMNFPQAQKTPVLFRLQQLQNNGPFWGNPKLTEGIENTLNQRWDGRRQEALDKLSGQIRALLRPGLIKLDELAGEVALLDREKLKLLEELEPCLQLLVAPQLNPDVNRLDAQEYLAAAAMKALKKGFKQMLADDQGYELQKAIHQFLAEEV